VFLLVNLAVDLNHQPCTIAAEIDDVSTDRVLLTELEPVDLIEA
jgi:hypothetical protein